jgi:hypothetical protein
MLNPIENTNKGGSNQNNQTGVNLIPTENKSFCFVDLI